MTSVLNNVYIEKLADIVNEYNNTSSLIKVKPVDVKSSTYIGFHVKNIKEDPKFEVGDHVRISKYKNIFAKCYISNWFEEVFVIKKVKKNGEKTVGTYYEKELQKLNKKEFRVDKVILRK